MALVVVPRALRPCSRARGITGCAYRLPTADHDRSGGFVLHREERRACEHAVEGFDRKKFSAAAAASRH